MQSLPYQSQKMVWSESQKGKVSPIKQIEPILVSGPVEHHPWLSTNLTKCENDFFRMMILIRDRFGLNMFRWFVMKNRNCFYYYCYYLSYWSPTNFQKLQFPPFSLYPSPLEKHRFSSISSPFSKWITNREYICIKKWSYIFLSGNGGYQTKNEEKATFTF